MLRAAATHEGAALVEIYQNCPVFNDGAFAALTEKDVKDANQIRLEARRADPVRRRGRARRRARPPTAAWRSSTVADVGEDALIVHDPHRADPGLAFSLARLAEDPTGPTPIGIFRDVERPVFGRTAPGAPSPASERRAVGAAARRRQLDRRLIARRPTRPGVP